MPFDACGPTQFTPADHPTSDTKMNNVLAFPSIFRGPVDDEMKMPGCQAIAVPACTSTRFGPIIPLPLDDKVLSLDPRTRMSWRLSIVPVIWSVIGRSAAGRRWSGQSGPRLQTNHATARDITRPLDGSSAATV
jgi:hypothetical protein